MYAIRGATTVDNNDYNEIFDTTIELLRAIMRENNISPEGIGAVIFSNTADITKAYPAAAARQIGFERVPLFSCQEPQIENSLEKCIRVLIMVNSEKAVNVKHIYLKGARCLREDLND